MWTLLDPFSPVAFVADGTYDDAETAVERPTRSLSTPTAGRPAE